MADVPDPLLNTDIGSYRITSKIGVGGMGAVYLAVHPLIGKRVAVKVLHAEFAEKQDVVQRFLQEAKAVSVLHHSNIVEVIDFGQLPPKQHSLFYCVMELLEGEVLRDRMKAAGAMPEAQAAHIAAQIADGVGAAHREHIIHRDLKPENVFLVGPERDTVKILDFGIAKLTGEGQASMQTQAGQLLGTPSYMAPEQCMARTVDARTDVYALGIILFEMCCGRLPFIGEGYADLLIKQINGETPAPRSINPDISLGMEHVILRALQKDPSLRFQSMDEFQAALTSPALSGPLPELAGYGGADPEQTLLCPGSEGATLPGAAEIRSNSGSQPTVMGRAPRSGGGALIGLVVVALLVASGAAFLLLKGDGHGPPAPATIAADETPKPPAPPPPPQAPEKVHLHITSEPAGATVQRDDGAVLGQTPLDALLDPGITIKLSVHKDGFKDEARAVVIGERDKTLSLQLTAEAPQPAPRAAAHHAPPAHGGGHKPVPTNLGDDILRPSL